jgi:hypothetical protein
MICSPKGGSGVPPLFFHRQEAGRLFHLTVRKMGAKRLEQDIFPPRFFCLPPFRLIPSGWCSCIADARDFFSWLYSLVLTCTGLYWPQAARAELHLVRGNRGGRSAADRNQRRNGRKGTQRSQKNKRYKLLSMCSLRSFVAKVLLKKRNSSAWHRGKDDERAAATKRQKSDRTKVNELRAPGFFRPISH